VQALHDLTGRTALVTGGSRALGLQMARALGEAGARVLITARKPDELAEAVADLRARGIEADSLARDGASEAQVMSLAQAALHRLGRIDILINNAGTTWGAPAAEFPTEAWDKVMNLNVRGLFLLSREVARRSMLPAGSGRIVNIASIAALGGSAEMQAAAYHASKGAVTSLTRALACEWGPHGVNVNAILPGLFPSRMSRHLVRSPRASEMAERLPLRRLGDDEGLKGAVLLLASDAGKHITGQCLAVDGGASALVGG
jgi:gluconate 5-dehydrogenase